MGLKRHIRTFLKAVRHWLDEADHQTTSNASDEFAAVPFDNSYQWLYHTFARLMNDPVCARRPQYIYGVLQGAALGKVLGLERISVIEFGVAGGAGLLSMKHVAERTEEMVSLTIDVYGFDSGTGLPKMQDYRDCPFKWFEGYYPTDLEQLRKRLGRACLKLGLLEETVPALIAARPAPVAFVAIDLCLYSSTKDALKLFEADHALLLPRVACSFRSTVNKDISYYTSEHLAITEFNSLHTMRKLSPMPCMRYFVPQQFVSFWAETFYALHIFDHPLYNRPESFQQSAVMDIDDNEFFQEVSQ